jgi:hypothetical protein
MTRAAKTSQTDMFDTQTDLFGSAKPVLVPRGPNPQMVRNRIHYELEKMRGCEVLPWINGMRTLIPRIIPEMAVVLPPEEAEALLAEFNAEWARLEANSPPDNWALPKS